MKKSPGSFLAPSFSIFIQTWNGQASPSLCHLVISLPQVINRASKRYKKSKDYQLFSLYLHAIFRTVRKWLTNKEQDAAGASALNTMYLFINQGAFMLYRKMPKNGEELSILGFGCMRLPMKGRAVDEKRAINQIRYAVEHGINYFDTAWPYHFGSSEIILGKALRGGYRAKVKIATKLPTWLINSEQEMDSFLNAQLEKLATNKIDYYLVHALNGVSWDKMKSLGVMTFLDRAKEEGRIGHAGFSFHGLLADFKRIIDDYSWDFCQIQYNYLDQELQAGTEGLLYAARNNLGLIIMEPLRGGNLGISQPPEPIKTLWSTAPVERTPVEWALRWIWDRPEVTVILSGMNEEEHIEENIRIAATACPKSLTQDERDLVDKVSNKYMELMKVGCTGCGYCMPCPEHVMIPSCFEVYNKMHMFGETEGSLFSYAIRMSGDLSTGEPGFASQCVSCGECLDKCPQGIPIPEILTAVAEEMEGPDLQQRVAMAVKMLKADS